MADRHDRDEDRNRVYGDDRGRTQGRQQDKGSAYGQDYGRAEEGRRTREFGAGWQDQNRFGRRYDEGEGRRQGGMEGGYGDDSGFGQYGRGQGESSGGGWRGRHQPQHGESAYGSGVPRSGQFAQGAMTAPPGSGREGYGGDAGQFGGIYSGQGSSGGAEDNHDHEPDYLEWRKAQLRQLDEEYRAFREHRRKTFADEFSAYRKNRQAGSAGADGGVSPDETGAASTPKTA